MDAGAVSSDEYKVQKEGFMCPISCHDLVQNERLKGQACCLDICTRPGPDRKVN